MPCSCRTPACVSSTTQPRSGESVRRLTRLAAFSRLTWLVMAGCVQFSNSARPLMRDGPLSERRARILADARLTAQLSVSPTHHLRRGSNQVRIQAAADRPPPPARYRLCQTAMDASRTHWRYRPDHSTYMHPGHRALARAITTTNRSPRWTIVPG
jgi:hypothetical protein